MYEATVQTPTPWNRRVQTRPRLVALLALAVVGLMSVIAVPQADAKAAPIVLTAQQSAMKNALNKDRSLKHLKVLVSHREAQAKAQAWAVKIARDGKLSHSKPTDGIHAHWCGLGENVAYGTSVAAIENAWMHSKVHRTNILNPRFNVVGVGFALRGNVVYGVQFFMQVC